MVLSESERADLIAKWSFAGLPRIKLHPGVEVKDLIKWLKYPHDEAEIKTVREFLGNKVPEWF